MCYLHTYRLADSQTDKVIHRGATALNNLKLPCAQTISYNIMKPSSGDCAAKDSDWRAAPPP